MSNVSNYKELLTQKIIDFINDLFTADTVEEINDAIDSVNDALEDVKSEIESDEDEAQEELTDYEKIRKELGL